MYELQVLRRARKDMRKSAGWYDERLPGLGDRFLQEVIKAFRLIENNPFITR